MLAKACCSFVIDHPFDLRVFYERLIVALIFFSVEMQRNDPTPLLDADRGEGGEKEGRAVGVGSVCIRLQCTTSTARTVATTVHARGGEGRGEREGADSRRRGRRRDGDVGDERRRGRRSEAKRRCKKGSG